MFFNKTKLVSLHIPKSAGTSFQNTLIEIYSTKKVARLNIKPQINKLFLNGMEIDDTTNLSNFDVLHDHFSLNSLYHHFPFLESLPLVTWLRNPVDRVLSNYYYLNEILVGFLEEHEQNRTILDKMMKTIDEFIHSDINRNLIHQHLTGYSLNYFKFIGIVENYDNDLAQMAKHFSWPLPISKKMNVSKFRRKVDDTLRKTIELLNEKDMAIYQEALSLKQQIIKI
jgi:Sulfotransferase family